ncbi:MAG: hypothetical protein LUB58_00645, partial [Oscillospiraceae bacterium]|nr:hypothetical protein [Oscillospiraceae bacterium]
IHKSYWRCGGFRRRGRVSTFIFVRLGEKTIASFKKAVIMQAEQFARGQPKMPNSRLWGEGET